VYDAIYNGRCYAVTGEPTLLSFSASDTGTCRVHVRGTDDLQKVVIRKGNKPVYVRCHIEGPECRFEWTDPEFDAGMIACYFVEVVQVDGEMAWSSPVWI